MFLLVEGDFLYIPTLSEELVSNLYIELGITNPNDINIDFICYSRNITYTEIPMHSHYLITSKNEKYIFVDSRLNKIKKREHFFHEWTHVELHEGNQTSLPYNLFIKQENDANNLSQYALIPFHMLNHIDFYSDNIVNEVKETFNVSTKTCVDRLSQIKRRVSDDYRTLC